MKCNLKNNIIDFLNRHQINSNDKFVLAVSTGVDSMVLLHLFLQVTNNIVVAHMNHQKRTQSDVEEEFIIKYCAENNITCYTKKLANKNEVNFQSYAREERYQFFHEVCIKENAKWIVLAHHLDDLAETMIMKMMRSSSITSLAGIKEVMASKNSIIIRPLLKVRKSEILAYAKANNVKYFDDYTNDLDVYTRNQIRHNVIPALLSIYPDALEKLNCLSLELNEASLVISNIRDSYIQNSVTFDNCISFSYSTFKDLSEYLKQEVLFELLKKYSLSKANILELLKMIESSKQNIKNWFKSKFTFVKEYDKIMFYDYQIEKLDISFVIDSVGKYQINDNISINVIENSANMITNLNQLWYNIEELPITIRTRQDGDRIKVGKGYKKVKDLLIDEKVGIIKRDNVLLATDKNGEVLIVFGVKRSSLLNKINKNVIIELEEKNNG